MFKKFVAGAALAAAFAISPTVAADMTTKAPVAVPPPPPSWTRFNVGLSLGGRWGDIDGTSLSFGGGPVPFPALANQSYDSSTFRVGGYLGYDRVFTPDLPGVCARE